MPHPDSQSQTPNKALACRCIVQNYVQPGPCVLLLPFVSTTSPRRIVCLGPGPRFKGGIAHYTTSLARALAREPGTEVHLMSWTQQYPAIIPRDFLDRSSRTGQLEGTSIAVHYLLNYNDPFSWRKTYRQILSLKPEKVVVQWAIALQGIPLGFLCRWLKKHPEIELVYDLHLVAQKESTPLDYHLTRWGIPPADTYIVHAQKTLRELQAIFPTRRYYISLAGERSPNKTQQAVLLLYHPVYDMFRPDPSFDTAREREALHLQNHVFLFFGFIRKYKGLHWCLEAFSQLVRERSDVSLLVVGERFWHTVDTRKPLVRLKKALFSLAVRLTGRRPSDEQGYNPLARILELGIQDRCVVIDRFVPNEEVPRYFQVADAILLFYEDATPSGVESIAYNFRLPILATRVGHFPETVVDGKTGYLAERGDIASMTQAMLRLLERPIDRENIDQRAQQLSWARYAQTILHP